MVKIAVIGEHSINDSSALINLLNRSKRYEKKDFRFTPILGSTTGSQLDENIRTPSKKAIRLLRQAFLIYKFDFVIYVRDLDSLPSDEDKIKLKHQWFKQFENQAENGKGIFFLAIWELESLILADIDSFNRMYKSKVKFTSNPMWQKDPKEFLKFATSKNKKKYKESDCSDIFKKLNLSTILKNHQGENSFKTFINDLDKK